MKKKILYINTVCGFSSTGKITADLARSNEYESLVCFGRKKDFEGVESYKFANILDNCIGALSTILFDNNLNICSLATKRLIKKIQEFNPDIIHLHNLHGYYLNVDMLFKFLKNYNKPVVWTLHDCWSITGYCPHFDMAGCDKYKTKCSNCQYCFSYPFSIFKQNVKKDYEKKKELFNSIDNLTIVTPSSWLKERVQESFIKNCRIEVINNGISIIEHDYMKNEKFSVIAVSSYWTKEKGKEELKKIIPLIDDDIKITVVGDLKDKDPVFNRCNLIKRTTNYYELFEEYGKAHILINPTLQEVFGLVNVEAQSCGTAVVTYKTGGSVETINEKTGVVVEKGDYRKMAKVINELKTNYLFNNKDLILNAKKFSKENMLKNYLDLYKRTSAN